MIYNPTAREPEWITVDYDDKTYKDICHVFVSGEEYEYCEYYSDKIWAQHKTNSHAVAFASRAGDKKRGERIGFIGQVAFAAVCGGLPVDFAYREGGDIADFFIRDKNGVIYTIDVKTRTSLWGNGLIFYAKPYQNSNDWFYYSSRNYYVFGYRVEENRKKKWCHINLVGFNQKFEVWKSEYLHRGYEWDGSPSKHWNLEVPFSAMHPFQKMHNYKADFSFDYVVPER
jgi:hypothetical protein